MKKILDSDWSRAVQIMIFLTVEASEIGRNRYFAGTDQRTGTGY